MLFIRLLAVFLILITNTWLLFPVRSDALNRYKRSLARRADTELSRLAGEPCTVSGVSLSRRQPSFSGQHRPPAASPRTATSRRAAYSVASAPEGCAGGCRFDAPEEKGNWGDGESGAVKKGGEKFIKRLYEKDSGTRARPSNQKERGERREPAELAGRARSRFARSLAGRLRSAGDGGNSSSRKVSLHGGVLQRGDEDTQSSNDTQQEEAAEDYSGEVEEADADSWGNPVPTVPPSWMTALYFNRRQEHLQVKLRRGADLPKAQFSLELWVKPEGGQSNPAVIAGGCKLLFTTL